MPFQRFIRPLPVLLVIAVLTVTPLYSQNARNTPSVEPDDVLLPLILERDQAASTFGIRHPKVVELDRRIELTKKSLAKRIASDPPQKKSINVTQMNDADLRRTVQRLLKRVRQLEEEVAELKARRPRTELLKHSDDS